MGGGVAGETAVAFGAALLGVTPVGWVVLGAVLASSLALGYHEAQVGRRLGRGIYEEVAR